MEMIQVYTCNSDKLDRNLYLHLRYYGIAPVWLLPAKKCHMVIVACFIGASQQKIKPKSNGGRLALWLEISLGPLYL